MKQELVLASDEKDVERIYRTALEKAFKTQSISTEFKTDGYLESGNLRLLLECKKDEDFTKQGARANVLSQCIYYIKKFELAGKPLPTIILVGDINECFVIHVNDIIQCLYRDEDWTVAPSANHPDLMRDILRLNLNPFVYNINDNFDFKEVIEKIKGLDENIAHKIKITEHNIDRIFTDFIETVIPNCKLATNDKVNLFVQCLINSSNNYLHPSKPVLITENFGEVIVKRNEYEAFFAHFDGINYSPREKENLVATLDRLIDDTTRRTQGEFFTPTAFVDLAHKYIGDTFGKNWKDEYVVWDCAAGTGNLTRDYRFKELYCSTLHQSDLDSSQQYNKNAVKFQYDFLNDDMDPEYVNEFGWKMPEGLVDAIQGGKKILFLINPPYAASTGGKIRNNSSQTLVGKDMSDNKFGLASKQLTTQFLYRISQIPNAHVALFSKTSHLNSNSFKIFRNYWNSKFQYRTGFFFNAGHFADVSTEWGISFTLYKQGDYPYNTFDIDLVDEEENGLEVVGGKRLYNLDNQIPANKWIDRPKGVIDAPRMSTELNIKETGTKQAKLAENALGWFYSASNIVSKSIQGAGLFSSTFSNADGMSITANNFNQVLSLYGARRLSASSNWISDKDEYIIPNIDHPDYQQFVHDSLIIALFDHQSQQGSLRQVEYKDKLWDIKNEFFWLGKDMMKDWANKCRYDNLYYDAVESDERYVFKQLFNEGWAKNLSSDAYDVLNMATQLLKDSMEARKTVSLDFPEWHLDSWDAGYGQLKRLWKITHPEEFEAFRRKYKELCDRMRPLVYELGFLRK